MLNNLVDSHHDIESVFRRIILFHAVGQIPSRSVGVFDPSSVGSIEILIVVKLDSGHTVVIVICTADHMRSECSHRIIPLYRLRDLKASDSALIPAFGHLFADLRYFFVVHILFQFLQRCIAGDNLIDLIFRHVSENIGKNRGHLSGITRFFFFRRFYF